MTKAAIAAIAFAFSLTLAAVACGADSTSVTAPLSTPTQASQTATADSIDVVYSFVASIHSGEPLSPLFGDRQEDRAAIERLALALDAAVVTGGSARIAIDQRGRFLAIRFRDGEELIVRQVLRCETQAEIARMSPASAGCNGRYVPLADTWWVEGRDLVKSPELGHWWEDMPSFMVPIGSITLPEIIYAGDLFSLTTCCWENILQTPTMALSLVVQDDTEIQLGELPTGSDFAEAQLTVPDPTPEGRYWLRVSSNGFSELVEVVLVR